MLITRYSQSLSRQVDVNGSYHSTDGAYATSSFSLRRVRVQAKAQISARAEAAVLLNLTDFTGNPSNKVLENAFFKYHINDYINLQAGQFRPYFGREDLYPEELLQALEWSNLYYAFGANGWQSFQAGATLFGKVAIGNTPVNYYLGVFNGNGRNQAMDNDNSKLFPMRVEVALHHNTKLGLNGGLGKDRKERIWAFDADLDHVEKLTDHLELEVQAEYKKGTNNSQFDTSSERNKAMADYQLSGYYMLPNLRYNINDAQVKSIEFAVRYEQLNGDAKRNGCTRQTCMPVLCLQFENDYFLRLQTGLIIDRYRNKNPASTEHNATRFICQLQARF